MKKKSANKNDKDTKDALDKDTKDALDIEEADIEEALDKDLEEEADAVAVQGLDKLAELKKATDIKLSSHFHISKKINDVVFAYTNVHPDIARQAMEIASQEHSMIYLDYIQKLTMLGEELADRMLDASNEALQRSIKAREKAILKRTEQNRSPMEVIGKTTSTRNANRKIKR